MDGILIHTSRMAKNSKIMELSEGLCDLFQVYISSTPCVDDDDWCSPFLLLLYRLKQLRLIYDILFYSFTALQIKAVVSSIIILIYSFTDLQIKAVVSSIIILIYSFTDLHIKAVVSSIIILIYSFTALQIKAAVSSIIILIYSGVVRDEAKIKN